MKRRRSALIDDHGMEDQAAFSPDGRMLAFVATARANAGICTLPFRPQAASRIDDWRRRRPASAITH